MKVYNLKRAGGKTARILTLSEFTGKPVLCASQNEKQNLIDYALRFNYKIPEPITVTELHHVQGQSIDREYLVDEALSLLRELVKHVSNGKLTTPLAVSLSTDDE